MFQGGLPKAPVSVGDLVGQQVISAGGPKKVQAGFAYATVSGLTALRRTSAGYDWLSNVDSEWVISVDQGITEPAALKLLRETTNANVRVYLPQAKLAARTLFVTPKFHAKVIRVQAGAPLTSKLLWVGSANATGGALGHDAKNFEVGYGSSDATALATESPVFDAWWQVVWGQSKPLTPSLIGQYTEIRSKTLRKNPILLETMESPSQQTVGKADVLWMDVGSASGGARNQIEFNETLAAFFGVPTKVKKQLDIIEKKTTHSDRPLSHKETTYHVDIWRLGLPTTHDYPGKRIRLTRLKPGPGGKPRFELAVTSPNSARAKEWFADTNKNGHVGSTRGSSATKPPREYGYY